jgi:hypothetical protein
MFSFRVFFKILFSLTIASDHLIDGLEVLLDLFSVCNSLHFVSKQMVI